MPKKFVQAQPLIVHKTIAPSNNNSSLYDEGYDVGSLWYENSNLWELQKTTSYPNWVLIGRNITSSGLVTGGQTSINPDTTKFDIQAGVGIIINFDNVNERVEPLIFRWTAKVAQSTTNRTLTDVSYIGINSNGTLVQNSALPTNAERRSTLFLATLHHVNRTVINTVTPFGPQFGSLLETTLDIVNELGLLSSGNKISANGANMIFNKSAGSLFGLGINGNYNNPNKLTVGALISNVGGFKYRTQLSSTDGVSSTVINPASYDLNGVITANGGGGGTSTNQYVFLLNDGTVAVQYGQLVYSSLANAIAAIPDEVFIQNPYLSSVATPLAIISLTKDCAALNNTAKCKITPVSRFGNAPVSVQGNVAQNMQAVYDASGVDEIVTTSANGALTVKDGIGTASSKLFEGKSISGNVVFEVDKDGYIKSEIGGVSAPTFWDATKRLVAGTASSFGTWINTLLFKNDITDSDGIVIFDANDSFKAKQTTFGALKTFLNTFFDGIYQPTLISFPNVGANIKTINGQSILGASDIVITGGGGGGATNISITKTPTTNTVVSDTGSDGVLSGADSSNAGLLIASDKEKLDAIAIVSDAEMITGLDETKTVTALRANNWWGYLKGIAHTFVSAITFNSRILLGVGGSVGGSGESGIFGVTNILRFFTNGSIRFELNNLGIKHSFFPNAGVVNTDNLGQELTPIPIVDSNFTVAQQNYVNGDNWGTNATITEITLGFRAGQYYLNSVTGYEYTVYQADNVARKVIGGAKAYESMQKTSWPENLGGTGGNLIANQGIIATGGAYTIPACVQGDILEIVVKSGTVTGITPSGGTPFTGLTNSYAKLLCVTAPSTFINIA